jgi:hypothetical protein
MRHALILVLAAETRMSQALLDLANELIPIYSENLYPFGEMSLGIHFSWDLPSLY